MSAPTLPPRDHRELYGFGDRSPAFDTAGASARILERIDELERRGRRRRAVSSTGRLAAGVVVVAVAAGLGGYIGAGEAGEAATGDRGADPVESVPAVEEDLAPATVSSDGADGDELAEALLAEAEADAWRSVCLPLVEAGDGLTEADVIAAADAAERAGDLVPAVIGRALDGILAGELDGSTAGGGVAGACATWQELAGFER